MLDGAKFLGQAVTPPEYTMISLGGFPGVAHAGITSITGELYEVNSKTLEQLDRLEGHPDFYHREPIEVTMEDGSPMACQTYLLGKEWLNRNYSIVPDGDWASVRKGRKELA